MNIITNVETTWCPGCTNYHILGGFRNFIEKEIKKGKKKDDFAIVSGIGCHAKIFDYVDLNGLNTLHGRVLPACLGIKIGNPNLTVFGFAGDGDAYAEGASHLIHAARYNADINYLVHNNQVFALTVGQPTPTTEMGYRDKTTPAGVKILPLNPIKLMLASGATFVARVFSDDKQVENILRESVNHKGFSFIEVIQPCVTFHPDIGYKEKTYSLKSHNKRNFNAAWKKAEEFEYNTVKKIPVGIFYQTKRETFEDNMEQLRELKRKKIGWKDIRR